MTNYKLICIVEDNEELRNAMGLMLGSQPELLLGGSFPNAEMATADIPEILPDAVLVDINLPGSSGIDCVANLKNKFPHIQFLMCTAYEDDEKIFSSLKAGASGYILKSEGPSGILVALNEMLRGGSPMSWSIAKRVIASFREIGIKNGLLHELSSREVDILELLSKGLICKEVATSLSISIDTVRKHIQNIYHKLQVNSRVEAVNLYLKR